MFGFISCLSGVQCLFSTAWILHSLKYLYIRHYIFSLFCFYEFLRNQLRFHCISDYIGNFATSEPLSAIQAFMKTSFELFSSIHIKIFVTLAAVGRFLILHRLKYDLWFLIFRNSMSRTNQRVNKNLQCTDFDGSFLEEIWKWFYDCSVSLK